MAKRLIKDETLTAIADAIRSKTNMSENITVKDFSSCIESISIGVENGVDTSDATATASDIKSGQTAYVNGSKIYGTHICSGLNDLTNDATAIETDILFGKTAYVDGVKLTGTMLNNGSVSKTLNAGEIYNIQSGFHDGTGTISSATLSSQTIATATPEDIKTGKTAYVNGEQIVGTHVESTLAEMTADATAKANDISTGQTAYVNGEKIVGTFVADTLKDMTSDANAIAEHILDGNTAYVNGEKLIGAMVNNGSVSEKLYTSSVSYTIPQGYHDGTGEVYIVTQSASITPSTEKQTVTPNVGNVLSEITVEAIPNKYQDVSDVTATADKMLTGYNFVNSSGNIVSGTMTNNGAVSKSLNAGASYTIPAGYHSGSGKVTANSLSSQTSATATVSDIASGKTAWVNGTKITGNASIATPVEKVTLTMENTSSDTVVFVTPDNYYRMDGSGSQTCTIQIGQLVSVTHDSDVCGASGTNCTRLSRPYIGTEAVRCSIFKITSSNPQILVEE